MLKRHLTQIVFWGCIFLSLLSIVLVMNAPQWAFGLLLLSAAINVWSIVRSEGPGFVNTRQARRAHEPARHFSVLQIFLILCLVIAQISAGVYRLLTEA